MNEDNLDIEENGEAKINEDFDLARSNLLMLAKLSNQSVKELYNLANQSQNPRLYEALNTAIKSAVDANKTILDVHETVRRTSTIKGNQPQQITTQNNLYLTTSQLQEMIAKAKEPELIEHQANTES